MGTAGPCLVAHSGDPVVCVVSAGSGVFSDRVDAVADLHTAADVHAVGAVADQGAEHTCSHTDVSIYCNPAVSAASPAASDGHPVPDQRSAADPNLGANGD